MKLPPAHRLSLPLLILLGAQCGELPTGIDPEPQPEPQAPQVPATLTAAPVRAGEIELAWADVAGETEYRIESRGGPGTIWLTEAAVAANSVSYRETGLRAGSIYGYRVQACNDAGCSGFSPEATATATSPGPPSGLTATAAVSGRIELAWKDNSQDETGFEVEYRPSPGNQWYPLTRTAVDVTGLAHMELDAGDTYSYRVRACAESGCSEYSPEAAATVLAPAAPTDLRAQAVGSGRIDLRWKDNSGDETGFRVEYRSGSSTYWYVLANTPANDSAYAHTGLDARDTYAYRVRSCNASGCSQPTPEAQATAAPPAAPSALTAVAVRSGRINLAWQDHSADEASFRIEYREAPSSYWHELTSVAANTTAHAHTGLYAGITYTYRVRSCNAPGCSDASAEVQATVLGPVAPTNLAATTPWSGRVNLAWQDNSADETSFRLQYRSATSSYWSVLRNLAPDTRSFGHTGLRAGDSYVYRVSACNASGCSEDSNEVRATVRGPEAPSGLTATGVTGAISISWRDNSSDEDYFDLQARPAESSYWSLSSKPAAGVTSHTHNGLTAGDAYVYRIRACNTSGCSPYSNLAGAAAAGTSGAPGTPGTPGTPAPGTPGLISPYHSATYETREPRFSWSEVTGATAYWLMVAPAGVALPTDKDQVTCPGCEVNREVSGTLFPQTARLKPLTRYRWQVKARTAAGWTAWSRVYEFTTATVYCPAGWESIDTRRAAVLCRKLDAPNDFVLQVDLKRGGRIYSLQERRGNAFPDDVSPEFARKEIDEWWEVSSSYSNRFCVLNGAMYMGWEGDPFLDLRYRVALSYPLREESQTLTAGSERRSDQDLGVFRIAGQSASIRPYALGNDKTPSNVDGYLSAWRLAIVAFRGDYGTETPDNQTFVAVNDGDADGQFEVVLFYMSARATATQVRDRLRTSFGVPTSNDRILRLDGGGSSQLLCAGRTRLEGDDRTIPQAFGIFSEEG